MAVDLDSTSDASEITRRLMPLGGRQSFPLTVCIGSGQSSYAANKSQWDRFDLAVVSGVRVSRMGIDKHLEWLLTWRRERVD